MPAFPRTAQVRRGVAVVAVLAVACGAGAGAAAGQASVTTPTMPTTPTPGTTGTTSVATTPSAPGAPQGSGAPVDLTILASGDLLVHKSVWTAASAMAGGGGYDFAPMFRRIKPYVQGADIALCHVETPLVPDAPRGFPVFSTPPALARAIQSTGWDACSTASNHTLDRGQYGVDSTIAALRRNGIEYAGSASSPAGARRIAMLHAKGVTVAFLAYTQLSNGQPMPHAWSIKWASAGAIIADARRARRRGADAVVVNVHWGDEYSHAPNAAQWQLADALMRSRAVTAVVGQHVHVVQPVRRVRGKPVVFGEGNLISGQGSWAGMPPATGDGYMALLRVRIGADGRDRLRRVDYVPVYVGHPGPEVVPVGLALRRGEGPTAEYRASWQRTVATVGRGTAHGPWDRPTP